MHDIALRPAVKAALRRIETAALTAPGRDASAPCDGGNGKTVLARFRSPHGAKDLVEKRTFLLCVDRTEKNRQKHLPKWPNSCIIADTQETKTEILGDSAFLEGASAHATVFSSAHLCCADLLGFAAPQSGRDLDWINQRARGYHF
jgi:hypothetical protein